MTYRKGIKELYRVVRSVLFAMIAFVVFLYVALYIALSLPSVQNKIKNVAEKELTSLLGGQVEIGKVDIYPFNEVVIENLSLTEPDGYHKCLKVDRLGAGINLWHLIRHQKIIITYAELIGPDASIRQEVKDGPLNIQFLIDAFSPKDKNKPPARFDLQIANIVVRKGVVNFDKNWAEEKSPGQFDMNHIKLTSLNADVALPRLSNDETRIDLRRLAFLLDESLDVRQISGKASISNRDITAENLLVKLPEAELTLGKISLPLSRYYNFKELLSSEILNLDLKVKNGNPSEFSLFYQPLAKLNRRFDLSMNVEGNLQYINLSHFDLASEDREFKLEMQDVEVYQGDAKKSFSEITVSDLKLNSSDKFNLELAHSILPAVNEQLARMISTTGNLDLNLRGDVSLSSETGNIEARLESGLGNISMLADVTNSRAGTDLRANIVSDDFDLGKLLNESKVGILDFNIDADASLDKDLLNSIAGKKFDVKKLSSGVATANIAMAVNEAVVNGYPLQGVGLSLHKTGNDTELELESKDENFNFLINGSLQEAGELFNLKMKGDIANFHPSIAGLVKGNSDYLLAGEVELEIDGDESDLINSMTGRLDASDIYLSDLKKGRNVLLSNLKLNSENSGVQRIYAIDSDWVSGSLAGNFNPANLPVIVRNLLARSLPEIFQNVKKDEVLPADVADFNFIIYRNAEWMEFLNLPVKLLYEATLAGKIDGSNSSASLNFTAPYIQQGKEKLIQKTRLDASLNADKAKADFYSSIPTKKGVLDIQGDIISNAGMIDVLLGFNPGSKGAFYGDIHLTAELENALNSEGRNIKVCFLPSKLYLNGAEWNMNNSVVNCHEKVIEISNFALSHANQYITISGLASSSPADEVLVKLNNIDLSYVFDTLNIDVAQFGGIATGEAVGKALLSSALEAYTKNLHVVDLSYNDVVLGDGDLKGDFDISQKRVGIYADIYDNKLLAAKVDGGIWIGKDSLSFDFNADKVRIGFLKYYMKAFASKVDGRASGNALLYGTFKNVNMKARMFADSIAIKVDYTNVTYSGSDSIRIDPGYIRIADFELHDEYGHTAMLNGTLTHDCFHHPEFDFRIRDAKGLLLYDTNQNMNQVWYGRIFGSGSGRILGNDDLVRIEADMTTEENSTFTFVLNDLKEAADYRFLKFTDKQKAIREAETPKELNEPDEIIKAFQKKVNDQKMSSSVFDMDIRATLTPAVKMVLVMDPETGDKITARGSGPVNISYSSASDEMKMYGKYSIDEGVYNFSLQDLILKDFILKEGSSVSFNGDPMQAILNIRGAYRVNTNLTDLDMSFATDKDLNRVNVPVDAMLLVTGEMEHPDIKFDIELPTLNDETEQKVRSIISSEDMMNTQMIYLLALNRFYTPEYSGNSNTGGEWASVASSTLSSQLSNIISQMTDKVTIAPSLRSDKGDFSDLQVDVALSSRLFNNRLLINGNFGYRDRSTSSTTFIGDFDIEYLLNRSGNFRLKAYNHFNDQNYYLKSALTTQGIGVVWRKDFDRLFPARKKDEPQPEAED